jgi:aminomethyltransferase
MEDLKRTALVERHVQLGGKMVDFAGWLMPLQYGKGIMHEHLAVRSGVGLFDVSHMGEVRVSGPGAGDFVDLMATNLAPRSRGHVTYTPLCLDDGGIVDDVIIYCMDRDNYVIVVNASNADKDFKWLAGRAPDGVSVTDESAETAQLAVQGPEAAALVAGLLGSGLSDLGRFRHTAAAFAGEEVVVSRTGYTGEDGFEIYLSRSAAPGLWDALMSGRAGRPPEPVGLGARDTLRFEASYRLYGNDIDESTDPLEAGLAWTVKLSKGDFVGREALMKVKAEGPRRRFVGLEILERRIARKGCPLFVDGVEAGVVTSGTFAPYLEKSLAMGYLRADLASPGGRVEVEVRGKRVAAEIVKLPFLGGRV